MVSEVVKREKRSVLNQCVAASAVSLLCIVFGMLESWVSPSIILLISDESPLPSGRINMEEASWIASLHCIGCMFGNIFLGYLANHFGRKISLLLTAFPTIASWMLVLFAENVYYIYAARLIGGFFNGSGAFLIVPLFLTEISSDHVRGALTSTIVLAEAVGVVLTLVIANFCDFYTVSKVAIGLTTVFIISTYFIPESSLFLMKKGRTMEAEKSIRFYQNIRKTENERFLLDLEIDKLKRTLDDFHFEKSKNKSITWSDLSESVVIRKSIIIGIVLVMMTQFTGVVAMDGYTAKIFQDSGSRLTPMVSGIVVAAIQLIGMAVMLNIIDRFGRKPLLLASNLGLAFGLTAMGIFMLFKSLEYDVDPFNWIPITSLAFAVFYASLGVLSIPLILLPEIMPEKVKDALVSFCMALLFFLSFIVTKFLPNLIEVLQFHGCMFLFSAIAVSCAVFFILFLPETKGRSHEEIMTSLRN